MATMGRPNVSNSKKTLAQILFKIKHNPNFVLTNYMKHKLKNEGYLYVDTMAPIGPGRPREKVTLTPKSKAIISLAKNWGIELVA